MSGRPFDPSAHRVFWCPSCGEVLKTSKAAAFHDHGLDAISCTLSELGAWASGIVALLLWSQDGIDADDAPTYCAMRCYGDLTRIARDKWRCVDPRCAEVYGPR